MAILGYYEGASDGNWSAPTRIALRNFKAMNGLPNDEAWDAATERGFNAGTALRAAASIVGRWSRNVKSCQGRASGENAPIVIGGKGIEGGAIICEFASLQRVGTTSTWNADASCTKGPAGKAKFRMTVVADTLTLTAPSGTTSYTRCPRAGR